MMDIIEPPVLLPEAEENEPFYVLLRPEMKKLRVEGSIFEDMREFKQTVYAHGILISSLASVSPLGKYLAGISFAFLAMQAAKATNSKPLTNWQYRKNKLNDLQYWNQFRAMHLEDFLETSLSQFSPKILQSTMQETYEEFTNPHPLTILTKHALLVNHYTDISQIYQFELKKLYTTTLIEQPFSLEKDIEFLKPFVKKIEIDYLKYYNKELVTFHRFA